MVQTLKMLKEDKVQSYDMTIPSFQGLYAAYVKLIDYKVDCYASTHEDWFHLYFHNWQSDPIVSAREGQSLYSGLVIKSWNHHWQSARENQFCEFRRQTINDIVGITATQERLSDGKVIRECFALASTHDDVLKSDLLTKPEFLKTAFMLGFNFMDDILH